MATTAAFLLGRGDRGLVNHDVRHHLAQAVIAGCSRHIRKLEKGGDQNLVNSGQSPAKKYTIVNLEKKKGDLADIQNYVIVKTKPDIFPCDFQKVRFRPRHRKAQVS